MTLRVGQSAMLLGYGGNPADLRWSLDEGASAGSITSQGSRVGFALAKYQAPDAGGTFHASLTSAVDSALNARARIIVRGQGQVSVSVLPSSVSLLTNGSRTFHAQVTGTPNHAVNWSATAGSITPPGSHHQALRACGFTARLRPMPRHAHGAQHQGVGGRHQSRDQATVTVTLLRNSRLHSSFTATPSTIPRARAAC
ncbi:MAG: hypothetical protein IPP78_01780 [Holophagaceae bacterium]|nr:hypothetical protein [Holophagaceae bacterium]